MGIVRKGGIVSRNRSDQLIILSQKPCQSRHLAELSLIASSDGRTAFGFGGRTNGSAVSVILVGDIKCF